MNPKNLALNGIADAYLEWAIHTEFKFFSKLKRDEKPDEELVGVLIKWNKFIPKDFPGKGFDVVVPKIYQDKNITSLGIRKDQISLLKNRIDEGLISDIEISTPVATQRDGSTVQGVEPLYKFDDKLLIGIIDHGCPFANKNFSDSNNLTRVWQLWDQNSGATSGAYLNGDKKYPSQTNFAYGAQYSNADLQRIIRNHGESQAYDAVGMKYMRHNFTHGSHVMDVLAGKIPVNARVSESRDRVQVGTEHDGSATRAPTWKVADDAASKAKIVFVNLPQNCVDDPTGRWLGRNVLDGLHYICQCAGDDTKRLWSMSAGARKRAHTTDRRCLSKPWRP